MFWILAFLLTAIPVGLIMLGIYYMNEHEKQPLWMLGISFVGGWGVFFLVRYISGLLNGRVYEMSSDSPFLTHNWEFFLIAFGMIAVVEELSKFIIANICSFRSKRFKYPYDGIAYAVFVSLGFAFIENFKYLYEQGMGVAISRALFTIPVHAAFGVVMGYYLGLSKVCKIKGMSKESLKMRYIAFFSPLLLHGLYDYICNFNIPQARYILIGYTVALYALAFYKMVKFNKLDINMYQKKGTYQKDDIVWDYKDELSEKADYIQNKLFEQREQGNWNVNNQNRTNQNLNMSMFSGGQQTQNFSANQSINQNNTVSENNNYDQGANNN